MKIGILRQLPGTLYSAVIMELFERLAYYGMVLVLSIYVVDHLGIPSDSYGWIYALFTAMLYLLPLISGALADRFGYKPALAVAFATLTGGYFVLGLAREFSLLCVALGLIAVGGSIIKPTIAGTVTRTTEEGSTRPVGFGLYYMTINAGGLIGPVIAAQIRNRTEFRYVFWVSAAACALMLLQVLLAFREPVKVAATSETMADKMRRIVEIAYSWLVLLLYDYGERRPAWRQALLFVLLFPLSLVVPSLWRSPQHRRLLPYLLLLPWAPVYGYLLLDISEAKVVFLLLLFPWWIFFPEIWREPRPRPSDVSYAKFLLLLVIFSGFWGMINVLFGFMPLYVQTFTDLAGIEKAINSVIDFGHWLNPEVFISLDAALIVLLQAAISYLTRRWRTVSAMFIGTTVATVSWIFPALSPAAGVIGLGIFVWSLGEMTCSARFFQYCGTIAPKDQVAVYLGYSFFAIFIGNLYAGPCGELYERFIQAPVNNGDAANPVPFFAGVMLMGAVSAVGLALYGRFVAPHPLVQEAGE